MTRSPPPDWLVARPIAHRGLHDAGKGLVENSGGAALAAIEHGFAIECDVQLTRDGEAVVFHDFALDRLTNETGAVCERSAAALAGLSYARGGDRILPFAGFLALVAAQVPVVCEIKSRFDGDLRLSDRVHSLIRAYAGPIAVKSFDPAPIAHLRRCHASFPLGIVAEAVYGDPEWTHLAAGEKRGLAALTHFADTRPDFLSYRVADLPHAAPLLCRRLGLPVMTWTVRRPDQRQLAADWADQMVFEGFLP